ncbi:MAG: putative biofilm formation methyltransferase WspC [Stenotrophomonas maltophilia]|nr:MAG: putative biofilm formation methyltransferase WspC [Stenotrophomonas maltophilia]
MIDPRFTALLKQCMGLDAESVGESVIARAIRQCAERAAGGDLEVYWARLQASPAEVQALIEAMVVPETWFFRYPESFGALTSLAVQRYRQLAGTRPLRILSLPCATGEEPYSIVMALLDAGLPEQALHVDAMDIAPPLLERAAAGLYGRNAFRGSDLGYRERYFHAQGGESYLLDERVRRKVRFRSGNLLAPGLLANEQPYDYVFCRNVLIYFDRPTQEGVVGTLKRLCREDGVLFSGPAEANLLSHQGLQALAVSQSFAFQRREPVVQRAAIETPVRATPSAPAALARPSAPRPTTPRRPLPSVAAPAPSRTAPGNGLAEVASLADQGRSDEARQRCQALLDSQGPSAEIFYWLGLLSDAQGQADAAQGFYRKALYLKPDHQPSLVQLATLLAARGDVQGARRLQERAERGVKRDG